MLEFRKNNIFEEKLDLFEEFFGQFGNLNKSKKKLF